MTARQLIVAVLACGALASCATTIDEPENDVVPAEPGSADVDDVPEGALPALESDEPIEGGVITADVPATTIALTGSATDLLPEMSVDMSRLGSEIADGGPADETLERIEQAWERIRPEIEAERPELLNGIQATVDMARIGVERTRPADADKAFQIFSELVDKFTGDG